MDELGYLSNIYYFNEEGRKNLDKTIELVYERAVVNSIKKVLIFTSDGNAAIKLKSIIKQNNKDIHVIAVSFPQSFLYTVEIDGKKEKKSPPTSDPSVKEVLRLNEIPLVQGIMAFEDIVIPGVRDMKLTTIDHTLSLISGGLKLCVESILMSCDSGEVEQDEEVIAMSADTAIVASACKKQWLFHPKHGLEIKEIICKPKKFTIIKDK